MTINYDNEIRCINCVYSRLGFMECWCTYGGNEKFCPHEDRCEHFKRIEQSNVAPKFSNVRKVLKALGIN